MNEAERRLLDQRMLEESQAVEDMQRLVGENGTVVDEETIISGWFKAWRQSHGQDHNPQD